MAKLAGSGEGSQAVPRPTGLVVGNGGDGRGTGGAPRESRLGAVALGLQRKLVLLALGLSGDGGGGEVPPALWALVTGRL